MKDTKQALEELLMSHPAYRAQTPAGGEVLNKTLLNTLANNYDKELLDLLSSDDRLRAHFFTDLLGGGVVFKCGVFLSFINSYQFLPDSYTAYKQKIGLGFDAGHYLKQLGDVALNFPYKECVLKGGQTKDDQKRQEVFFNRVLAPDEVNRLLDDMAFTGWKRYTKEGETSAGTLRADDNMIIKGNNLVVLHSLRRRYGGKVKLIYIDPPYNTGNDSFGYNDSFNHSSWLVFMKNRLEAARPLLRDDGCIFVQCDDNEQAYLKVLMDEVFGRENFVNCIVVKSSETSGVKMSHTEKKLPKIKDYILLYKVGTLPLRPIKVSKIEDKSNFANYAKYYSTIVEDIDAPVDEWKLYNLKDYLKSHPELGVDENDDTAVLDYKLKNARRMIYRTNNPALSKLSFDTKTHEVISKTGLNYIWWEGKQMLFLSDYVEEGLCDLWTDISTININKEGSTTLKDGQKPESLLARIIELSTSPSDIVLDYHLGSGTTAAVAHKMGRQYIGVEQMDYIQSVTVERLRKVIAGEQGGVSKQTGWTGGGSFVYCEVACDAARYIERANKTEDSELDGILQEVAGASCLNWRVAGRVRRNDREGGGFEELSAGEKRQLIADLIDPNDLYVPYTEMEDATHGMTEEEKRLTREWYGEG